MKMMMNRMTGMANEAQREHRAETAVIAKDLLRPSDHKLRELTDGEKEQATGGKPHLVDGVINFFSWAACGFHHNYRYTGKKQTRIDLFWRVTFYQRICKDCGHEDWTRSEP